MSAQDLEQRARETTLLERIERMLAGLMREQDKSPSPFKEGQIHALEQIRAIVAALRQQPASVDLEQFRGAVDELLQFAEHDDSCGDHDSYNNASIPSCGCGLDGARERLLSIIDNAGKEECATCGGRGEVGGHTGQTPEQFDYVTEPCPKCAHQPAPVVDDGNGVRACPVLIAARAQGVQS